MISSAFKQVTQQYPMIQEMKGVGFVREGSWMKGVKGPFLFLI